MDKKQYEEIARSHLSDKRFQHGVNVARTAQELAVLDGVGPKKARLAGVLRDIIKGALPKEQLRIMDASGIMLTDVERCAPKLWHAIVGAAYLRCVLGIEDQEIPDTMRYHTTGRANISLLRKIVFMTGFISGEWDYEDVQELRETAHHSLQEAVMAGLIFTIQDLPQNQKPIHPDSLAAYSAEIVSRGKK